MKRIIKLFQALLILATVFAFCSLTGNVYFAGSATIAVGIFSAIMHKSGAMGDLAFEAPIIPDFTKKSIPDIIALSPEDRIKYAEEKSAYEIAVAKKEAYDQIEALKKEQKTGWEAEVAKIKKENEDLTKSLEDAILMVTAMAEKGGKRQAEKSELIKFIERDRKKADKTAGWEEVEFKAAALMTTANVIPNVAYGFNQLFGNYIDPEIHRAPKVDPFIMSLVDTQMAPGTESIWYVQRINLDGDAAFIGEGDAKPLIDGEYKEFKADVKEVAEFWKISERLKNHAPTVVNDFRQHAQELIELKMDTGVLSGDGIGDNLSGITTLASPFVVPTELANYYTFVNIYDVITAVATYVRLNNFKGNLTCVLNTVWMAKMMGIKNEFGDYVIPPFVTKDGKQVGEVTVRFENGMPDGYILLGDLKKFKARISENLKYAEGLEGDDFKKNLESRRIAGWLGTYLPSEYDGSIIYDQIAVVETAIANTAS